MKKFKKLLGRSPYLFLVIMLILSLGIFAAEFYHLKALNNADLNNANIASVEQEFGNTTTTATADNTTSTASNNLPDKAFVKVPFTVQAPNANWDATHEEACEEASLIMVKHFLDGLQIGTADQADREILNLIGWEGQNGYGLDITLAQLNEIAQKYYGISNGQVKTDITIDDIKTQIAAGHPVIVGAAGKILPNPNFKDGGPNYHMLVITGYDANGFITNDPGTRLGEDFRYTYDGLFNAIHDWNSDNILNGGKDLLVFE